MRCFVFKDDSQTIFCTSCLNYFDLIETKHIFVLLLNHLMYMKRLLFCFSLALFMCPVFSQNTLLIHQKDGQQFRFGFADKPTITYTENDLVLKTTKTELSYPLSTLAKLTFSDNATAVAPIEARKVEGQLNLENYEVCISGAEPGVEVSVVGADGKKLASYKTDASGCVSFSIAQLPEGIYVIKSESLTCKILKK